MPTFESPSLYIDFSRLPPPDVIETIDYEKLLRIYKQQVIERSDGKLARAVALEQSPTNVILEAEAYGEMLVRARVNAAARAVMLALSTGADLDNLAAFFGVERMTVPEDKSVDPPIPAHPESDSSLRRRAQLAPEAYTTAGSQGAYIFHALSAHAGLRDASAVKQNRNGGVRVTLMNAAPNNPIPTKEQVDAVMTRLNSPAVRPLTDVVSVAPVTVFGTEIKAEVTLYPGPDAALVTRDITKALTALRNRINIIGRDLTRSAIFAAINQEGVQNVRLISPAADVVANMTQCVHVTSASVAILNGRME